MSEPLPSSRDPLVGVLVDGRYLVENVIGRGGMGVVYAAVHEELRRAVAIKVLNPAWASDADAAARFLREARVASSLSHGNIVDVWDLGRLPDGRPYLVMPRIAGEDLGTMLAEHGPQHPKRVVKLLEGVAAALDLIHDKGFVHRDIKPENLLRVVREDGSEAVLVLDFGIAAAVLTESRMTKDGVLCGTPDFLPPEVLSGELPDRRGDVYALATVAFELMTGRLPFQGVNPFQLLSLKLAQPAPSLASMSGRVFPEALEHVIARGLAQRPEDRYATAGEFIHALGEAAEQAQTELPDLSTADTARHNMRQSAFIRRPQAAAEAPAAMPAATAAMGGSAPALRGGESSPSEPPVTSRERVSPPQVLIVDDEVDVDSLMPAWRRRSGGNQSMLFVLALALIAFGVYWTLRVERPPQTAQPTAPAAAPPAATVPAAEVPAAAAAAPAVPAGSLPVAAAAAVEPQQPPAATASPSAAATQAPPPAVVEPAAPREAPRRREEGRSRHDRDRDRRDESDEADEPTEVTSITPAAPQPAPPQSVLSIAPSAVPEAPVAPQLPAAAPSVPAPAAAAAPEPPQPPAQPARDRARARELTEQATEAMLRGQLSSALELYRGAVQADRGYAAAWRGRGLVLQELGRPREAAQALREFLRLEPEGAQAQMIRARLRSIEEAGGR